MPRRGDRQPLRTGRARALLTGGLALLAASAWATSSGTVPMCRDGTVEMLVGGAGARCEAGLGPDRLVRGRRGTTNESPAGTPSAEAATPTQVPTQVQRERDRDRQAILQQEMAREQQTLNTLLRAGAQADPQALRRTRDNLSALQRELGQGAGIATR